jgi:hypothetical protein
MAPWRDPSPSRATSDWDVRLYGLVSPQRTPPLSPLEDRLTGVTFGRRGQRISVLAYEDDITVFLTHLEDIVTVHKVMRTYERATGTQLNPRKSKALGLGGWSMSI